MDKIILIGGVATTGKTTLAKELSSKLNIPWISTDQIRSIFKIATNENQSPALFQKINDQNNIKEVVDLEIVQAEIIWNGVRAFIEHYHPWDGCIIEGVSILPHLVARDLKDKNIKTVFLYHTDHEKIANIIYERSKLPFIKTKTHAQQEAKIKQIELLNQRVSVDAEKYKFPTIEAHTENILSNVLTLINQ